jgi:hypothetical protein
VEFRNIFLSNYHWIIAILGRVLNDSNKKLGVFTADQHIAKPFGSYFRFVVREAEALERR